MRSFVVLILGLVFVGLVSGAELHVGAGQSYSTISSAIASSSSGDIIYIHEGTYYENNLIPMGGTTLSGVDGEDLPVIDARQNSFSHDWNDNPIAIKYDNINLYRLDVRDGATGSVIIEDSGVNNVEISYCRFSRSAMATTTDNAALVYIKPGTRDISVHHNYFETDTGGFHGIIYFRPNGGTSPFYNNEIRVNAKAHGYFIKHSGNSDGRLQMYNNFIVMNYGSSNDANAIFVSHDNVDIYNNLIIGNGGRGIDIGLDAGGCGGSGLMANHNTIYMGTAVRGTFKIDNDCGVDNVVFKNNILRRTSTSSEFRNINGWIYGSEQTWSGHHNMVFQNSVGSVLYAVPGGAYTMSSWKSSGQGVGSFDENPQFVDGSGSLNIISDFEISGGNARNGADDGEDIGADVSSVGTGVVSSSPEPCEAGNGEICCSDVLRAGDCCSDGDCVGLENCENYNCVAPASCVDGDSDGYGNPVSVLCDESGLDCDDSDSNVYPGAAEICSDQIDNDCDGRVDCSDSDCSLVPGCESAFDCTDLELLMSFNEDSLVTEDLSGNDNDGTVSGASYSDGVFDGAFDFDGGSDYIGANNLDFFSTSAGTVSAWFKSDGSISGDNAYVFSHRTDTSTSDRIYMFLYGADGDFYCGFGSEYLAMTSNNNVLGDGAWHHGVVRWSALGAECYLDGESIGTYSGALSGVDDSFVLGNRFDLGGDSGFNGVIDDLAIWSRALPAEEIGEIYDGGVAVSCGSGSAPGPDCGDEICSVEDGENCLNCAVDCGICDGGCVHDADLKPCDGEVSVGELRAYIDLWLSGDVEIGEVVGVIGAWVG